MLSFQNLPKTMIDDIDVILCQLLCDVSVTGVVALMLSVLIQNHKQCATMFNAHLIFSQYSLQVRVLKDQLDVLTRRLGVPLNGGNSRTAEDL